MVVRDQTFFKNFNSGTGSYCPGSIRDANELRPKGIAGTKCVRRVLIKSGLFDMTEACKCFVKREPFHIH